MMKYLLTSVALTACGVNKVPDHVATPHGSAASTNTTPIDSVIPPLEKKNSNDSIAIKPKPDINIKNCNQTPNKELGSTYITTDDLVGTYKGLVFNKSFTASATYQFRSEITATTWNEFIITQLSSVQPSEAQSAAEKSAGVYSNQVTGNVKSSAPFFFEDVRGCQLAAISDLTTRAANRSVTVIFENSLPVFNIAQFTTAVDLKNFLATPLSIPRIKAKIQSSNEADLKPGNTEGTLNIALIDEKALVPSGNKGLIPPDSDYAFKVSYNFGSARATAAMGLKPETTYFIKDGKIKATAIYWNDNSISMPRLYLPN